MTPAAKSPALSNLTLSPEPAGACECAPDRRHSERRLARLELEFTEDAEFFTGLSQDISEGGLFVATYYLFPVGTRLALNFELPDGTEIDARGMVRWVREAELGDTRPGVGVAFTELPERARLRIASYCARRPPLYVDF